MLSAECLVLGALCVLGVLSMFSMFVARVGLFVGCTTAASTRRTRRQPEATEELLCAGELEVSCATW